jgi:two-component system sensor histidine kinase KdpD
MGKSSRTRWFEILNGSVVHDLVRSAGQISVHVIAGEEPSRTPARPPASAARRRIEWLPYGMAALSVTAALGVAQLLQPLVGIESVDLIFLTAVVGIAVRFGLAPSLVAVGLASLAYNFFFLPPTWTLTVADPTNVAALVLFTVVAVVVSNLAGRARRQAVAAAQRTRVTEALYAFSRKLASSGVLDDVLWASAYQIASMLRLNVVLLLPSEATLAVAAAYPPEDRLDAADLAAARWTFDHASPAGRGADTLPGAKRLFLPMRTSRGVVGVIGLDSERPGPLLTPDGRRLLDALADQAGLAVERVHLVQDLDRARLAAETDRLRQALLTSISHDLKTPLAAILGAASTLRDLDADLSAPDKTELVGTVIEEAQRLNRFIANLLDMTRLEAGAVRPNLAPADVGEIVGSALARGAAILAGHHVEADLAPDLPTLPLDAVLFEQVLFNLLDNAAKYAEAGTTIRVEARRDGGAVVLRILDEGPGIPTGELEQVFDKFYRARKADAVRAGTGLGLAISRGFVEAMGGTIGATNRTDRSGAVFTITLPASADGGTP